MKSKINIFVNLFVCIVFFTSIIALLSILCSCGEISEVSIAIKDGTFKSTYYQGDKIDVDDVQVVVYLSDGSYSVIDMSNEKISSNANRIDTGTIGTKVFTILYENSQGKLLYVNTDIEVLEPIAKELQICGVLPSVIKQYSQCNLSNLTAIVTYTNGKTEQIENSNLIISSIDTSIVGVVDVEVSYGGARSFFSVEIVKRKILEMVVAGDIVSSFAVGEQVDFDGLQLCLHLEDNLQRFVEGEQIHIVHSINTNIVGTYEVKVYYVGDEYELSSPDMCAVYSILVKN